MVSVLYSGSSGLGSSTGRIHCVVFLGKTLYSHSASLDKMPAGGYLRWTSIPSRGNSNTPSRLHATETGINYGSCGPLGS